MSLKPEKDVLRRARDASTESFKHDTELRAALEEMVLDSTGADDALDPYEGDGCAAYRLLAEKGVDAETKELTRRLVAGSEDTLVFGHYLTWEATDRAIRFAAEDPTWVELLLPRLRAGWPGFLRFELLARKIEPAIDALRAAAPQLRPIMDDPGSHIEARTGVMRTLAALGAREIIPSLIAMLQSAETFTWASSVTGLNQTEPALAITAAEVLEYLGRGDDDAIAALTGALASASPGLRACAAHALISLGAGTENAWRGLVRAWSDPEIVEGDRRSPAISFKWMHEALAGLPRFGAESSRFREYLMSLAAANEPLSDAAADLLRHAGYLTSIGDSGPPLNAGTSGCATHE